MLKKASTGVLALSVLAGIATMTAPSVSAAPTIEDKDASLTLTKHLGAPVDGSASDGTKITDNSGLNGLPKLQGVAFDVYKVEGINLKTNEGWKQAAVLKDKPLGLAEIKAGKYGDFKLTKVKTVTTGANGEAKFETSDLGVYVVAENLGASTDVKNVKTGEAVKKNSITPSAPFMVTLPMTQPSGEGERTQWMYDVFAYPKNAADSITKRVSDKEKVSLANPYGDAGQHAQEKMKLSYFIDTSVTPGLTAEQIKTYVVGDKLDAKVKLVDVKLKAKDGTELNDSDFTVYKNDAKWAKPGSVEDAAKGDSGGKIEVVLTLSGIKKAVAGGGLETRLVVLADETVNDPYTVKNTATFIPNDSWWKSNHDNKPYKPEDPEDPNNPPTSEEVLSPFGALQIKKVDANNEQKPLAGAVFSVYHDTAGDCAASAKDRENLISAGHTTGTDGAVKIGGLGASDFYDGKVQTELASYCLVETKAPEGYNLQAQPMSFTITSKDGDNGRIADLVHTTVTNTEKNLGNSLPLTGGQGAAVLGGAGAALLLGAGVYALYRRKQNAAAEAEISS